MPSWQLRVLPTGRGSHCTILSLRSLAIILFAGSHHSRGACRQEAISEAGINWRSSDASVAVDFDLAWADIPAPTSTGPKPV